jgi:putative membrane protein
VNTRSQLSLWIVAGLLTPIIIIGGLLGAVSSGDSGLERVPVALVNNDELIRETDDAGEETIIFASKPLVTELVTSEDFAVDWLVTGSSQARALLASGDVYAIVEIPENFSRAVTTLDSDNPEPATFTIITDSSRSYVASVLADQIGNALASGVSDEFGSGITEGLFSAIVEIADGFDDIAEGSEELASAIDEVADGVGELNTGVGELNTGYGEFDDGLQEYTDGATSLSDGLDALSAGSSALSDISTGFSAIKSSGALTGNPAEATLNALINGLATAVSGFRSGVTELDKGADALDEGGQELASGSREIRDGIGDLYEGTTELEDGLTQLSEGSREFSDGVAEGAAELRENSGLAPSDQRLDVLTNPVVFDGRDLSSGVTFQGTASSVLVAVGMWLIALVYFLALPSYSSRVLGSTARTTALLVRATQPVLVMVASWSVIVVVFLHTLGGVAWSSIGFTAPIIVITSLALAALHFVVWAWNPRWLAPLSLGALIIQIVSLESVIPIEILPSFYQSIAGFTPLGWTTDALIASLAGDEVSRVVGSLVALGALTLGAHALSAAILRHKRTIATQSEVRLAA